MSQLALRAATTENLRGWGPEKKTHDQTEHAQLSWLDRARDHHGNVGDAKFKFSLSQINNNVGHLALLAHRLAAVWTSCEKSCKGTESLISTMPVKFDVESPSKVCPRCEPHLAAVAGSSSAEQGIPREPSFTRRKKLSGHDRQVTFTTDYTECGTSTAEVMCKGGIICFGCWG